jgi:lysophospholipase L1-like esterase
MRRRSTIAVALSGLIALSVIGLGLATTAGVSQAAPHDLYYVSLGDSYSVGFQPTALSPADPTGGTSGYTAYVANHEHLKLENFGCGGATTTSIVSRIGCGDPAALHPVLYPTTTQEQAALNFINDPANAGRVGLITISIGGNDITGCTQTDPTAAIACLTAADQGITTNVTALVTNLNAALTAAGDTAKIVGLTYPNVLLGAYVNPGGTAGQTLASESQLAFDQLINPTLQSVYAVPNGVFVNVTDAPYGRATAGGDTPFTSAHKTDQFGHIPNAVNEICQLTYFCSQQNIHANTRGYRFIGSLIVAALGPSA